MKLHLLHMRSTTKDFSDPDFLDKWCAWFRFGYFKNVNHHSICRMVSKNQYTRDLPHILLLSTEGTKMNKIVSDLKSQSSREARHGNNYTIKWYKYCSPGIEKAVWELREKVVWELPEETREGFLEETKPEQILNMSRTKTSGKENSLCSSTETWL